MVDFLDAELRTAEIGDYPGAVNGLQLENSGQVGRIFTAVDASLAVIEQAASQGGLLIVHHGLFWQGVQTVTGPFFKKLKAAMDGGLAIYSSHLPLDVHPVFGNNVLLAEAIGLHSLEPSFLKNGFPMGVKGKWGGDRADLLTAVSKAVGGRVHLCPGGHAAVGEVMVITGGAGAEIRKVAEQGVDAFVTGEGPHWSYIEAEELGINLLYGGHYATETFGVKALGCFLAEKYGLEHLFLDRPSGL